MDWGPKFQEAASNKTLNYWPKIFLEKRLSPGESDPQRASTGKPPAGRLRDGLWEVFESEAGVVGWIANEGTTLADPFIEVGEDGVYEGASDVLSLGFREQRDRVKTVPIG